MNMKTLLGTAAGLMVATGAYAADLPGEAAPAAVDYVKVCDSFGKGYFNIPGTETCIKIGGRVRAGLNYSFNAYTAGTTTTTNSDSYSVTDSAGTPNTLYYNKTTNKYAYYADGTTAKAAGFNDVTFANKSAATAAAAAATGGTGAANFVNDPSTSVSSTAASYKDTVNFAGSGRITLDSKSATDLGTLRTYTRFEGDSGDGVSVKQAFIQLGYVTVGRMDDLANGDVLFGDNGMTSMTGTFGDNTVNGASVVVDNLGGGFYVGAGVYANGKSFWYDSNTNTDGYNGTFQASVGIAKQSWGSFDLSGEYRVYTDDAKFASDYYGVKGTLELALIDKLSARTTATYYHDTNDNGNTVLSLAAKYGFTDSLSVYAGGVYAIRDAKGFDDGYGAQLGADYMIVPDLKLTAEVNYVDDQYTTGGTKGVTSGILRLQREF